MDVGRHGRFGQAEIGTALAFGLRLAVDLRVSVLMEAAEVW